MTSTKHASDRRPPVQIRRHGRPTAHPIQNWRRGHAGALVLSSPQRDPHMRPAPPAWSSLTAKAAATLSCSAGHSLPALLLGFVSWAVAELLFGFAAYAEAMYSPPPPKVFAPVDTQPAATSGLNLMAMQVTGTGYGNCAEPAVLTAERRGNGPAPREERRVSLTRLAAVCWSRLRQAQDRRRAIEELRGLDDRSLRDIGLARSDIETIVRYGARRE